MIIHSPHFSKSQQGTTVTELVVGQDIPATILDLCSLPVPGSYQGESVKTLIEGKTNEWRQDIFCESLFTEQSYPRMEAVRSKKWKYIRYFSKENDRSKYLPTASIKGEKPIYEELFNLIEDPKEQINLATEPEYLEVLQQQRERCQQLVVELSK